MNVRFTKTVSADYQEQNSGEVIDKTFERGSLLREVTVEKLSRNFSNLRLVNGDVALCIPNDSFHLYE